MRSVPQKVTYLAHWRNDLLDAGTPYECIVDAAAPGWHGPSGAFCLFGEAFKDRIFILSFFFEKFSHDGVVLSHIVVPASQEALGGHIVTISPKLRQKTKKVFC